MWSGGFQANRTAQGCWEEVPDGMSGKPRALRCGWKEAWLGLGIARRALCQCAFLFFAPDMLNTQGSRPGGSLLKASVSAAQLGTGDHGHSHVNPNSVEDKVSINTNVCEQQQTWPERQAQNSQGADPKWEEGGRL